MKKIGQPCVPETDVTVGKLFKVFGGGTPSTSESKFWQGSIPWITSADLDDDLKIKPRKSITKEAIDESATNLVPAGSVIVATRVGLGKVGVAETQLCFSQDCQGLIVDTKIYDPKFVALQLKQRVQIFRHISRGTTISGVTKKQLLDLPFEKPLLTEQHSIVAEIEKHFSRLDEAVANLKRVKSNLKRYKAAVLKAAVEGKLTEEWRKQHPDVEPASKLLERILAERRAKWGGRGKYKESKKPDTGDLPAFPKSWIWTTVDQLTWMVTSGSRGWGDYYSDTGTLFIRAQDIKTDSLNLETIARVRIPKNAEGTRTAVAIGDVLITITGANVTKSALVNRLSEHAFVSQHVALLKPCLALVSPYLFNWVVSPAHGRRTLEGWAYGAGKPGLSLEQVRSLPVALPPLAEQDQIVAEVERRLSVIEGLEAAVEANLTRTDRLRQSVLQVAFTGRLFDIARADGSTLQAEIPDSY